MFEIPEYAQNEIEEELFRNKRPVAQALRAFGFRKQKDCFVYSTELLKGQFELTVFISKEGRVHSKVTDASTREEYGPYRVPHATGTFVVKIRKECEGILASISQKCFEADSFRSKQTLEIIKHAAKKYSDKPEFLWPKTPRNAILRRKDNSKWYAALLTIPRNKLGLKGKENIEIIDLRVDPDDSDFVMDGKKYFPGYHMNKKHWFTIILDGSVPTKEILKRIHASYLIAGKR